MDIFLYDDFRVYLRDVLNEEKRRDPKRSQRFFLKKIGATSSGWLADIIAGRISLTDRYLAKMADALGLSQRESDFFECLVRYNQSTSLTERKFHLDKLVAFKEIHAEPVSADKVDFYSAWWHPAVRELLALASPPSTPKQIAETLSPTIDEAQAAASLDLLKSLGLVKKNAQGRLAPVNTLLRKDKGAPSPHIRQYLTQLMTLGMESLERHSKDNRDISAVTLALGEGGFQQVLIELKALRRRLLELAAKEKSADAIYQVNLQFFPLSHRGTP